MTGRAGPAAILASVVWDCTVSGPAPDGVCACALAFSTLLSSQGADAHHRRLLGSSGATLLTYRPALSLSTQFAGLGVVHYSLYNQHTRVRASRCRDALAWGRLAGPWSLGALRRPVAPGARRNIRQQKGSSQIGVHRHCGYGAGLRGSLAERASAECRQRISRAIGACDEDHDATMRRPAMVAARAACRVPPQPPHPVTGAHLREKLTHAPGTAPPDQPSVPLTHRGRKCRADKPCAVRTAGHRQLDARS